MKMTKSLGLMPVDNLDNLSRVRARVENLKTFLACEENRLSRLSGCLLSTLSMPIELDNPIQIYFLGCLGCLHRNMDLKP